MITRICNTCIIILIFVSGLESQILIKKGNVYRDGSEENLTTKDVREIVSSNPEAAFWLDRSTCNSRKANYFGVGAIVSGVGCYYLLKHASRFSEPDYPTLTLGLGVGALTCVLGTIGIYSIWKSNKQFDKGIMVYNNGLTSLRSNKEQFFVRLEAQSNKLGIVIDF